MVMSESGIVEQVYINSIVCDERAGNEWVRESLNAHGVVVELE